MTEYFTNDFSKEIWETKYQDSQDTTIEDTWLRVATALASVEKDKKKRIKEFYSILEGFAFTPGGRITANAGTKRASTTMVNCFTDGFEGHDQDSLEGIYSALSRQARILAAEGGYGICCNVMRPRGATIGGIGNQSPGAIKFLELWDKSSEIITSGSGKERRSGEKNSISKGAQLVSISVWHPDVIEFIEAKKNPGHLTKFNMSVLCTDDFMEAVQKDRPWVLVFPDYENYLKLYKEKWNGNIDKWINLFQDNSDTWGTKIYHTFESARELWALIMDNTYNRNEPGVQFVDTMNRMNNLYYCEYIQESNPCQPGWAKVLTQDGIRELTNIRPGTQIWSETGWTTVQYKTSSGRKEVYKYTTTAGIFYGTEEHKLVSNREKKQARNCDVIDILRGPQDIFARDTKLHPKVIMDGLVLGDGSVHKASNNLVYLCIGSNDTDYLESEISDMIKIHRPGLSETAYEIYITITADELPRTYKRRITKQYI